MMGFLQGEFEFPSMEAFRAMTDKAVNVYNTSTQWFLKGHSPISSREDGGKQGSNMATVPGSNVIPFRTSEKTGRNEPCP
ncbi:hypothetical protein [Fictibacillus sp. KU28468]|uniref:hypothetical protein n=1 Tax=Fictibacillus sp. KU28468 TaxID=2991053 RepID=UPI00223E84AA|nr:hypothetical protein [Fictibacillus sp. KU28468]UZJ78595.1 hypothetical protein OKX00_21155 [Fictibacillus sp. KU28468]